MRRCAVFLAGVIACVPGLATAGDDPAEPKSETVTLELRTFRRFKIKLPNEVWRSVGDGIPVAHANGERFAVEVDGTALLVDTDGDGETDTRVQRLSEGQVAPLVVKLRGKHRDGSELAYSVRLTQGAGGWVYAPAGAVRGKVGETRIQVVDRNGNGRYDDVGEDAVVIGRGEHACYLSKTVHVAGALRALTVSADGSSLTLSEFEGETGTLDMSSEFDSEARLQTAVLTSKDGAHSFDAARMDGSTRVPAGEYVLRDGMLVLGDGSLRLRGDAARTITVPADGAVVHEWGGPVRAEFDYTLSGGEIGFDPSNVRYFGRGGEEYDDLMPIGASPEFVVRTRETSQEILRVAFPGST